jgi:hypothetical protein
MPMYIDYTDDGGVLVRAEGIIVGNEIKEINYAIYESPEKIKQIVYQLFDFTRVSDARVSDTDILDIAYYDNLAAKINPGMIVAVVCEKELLFGLARMWEAYTDVSPIETMVFRDMESARHWIEMRLKKKSPSK